MNLARKSCSYGSKKDASINSMMTSKQHGSQSYFRSVLTFALSAVIILGLASCSSAGRVESGNSSLEEEPASVSEVLLEAETSTETSEPTEISHLDSESAPLLDEGGINDSVQTNDYYPQDNRYVLPDADKRVYKSFDLNNLSADALNIARYELFARHGVIFKDKSLEKYFGSKTWYKPTEREKYASQILNPIELTNFSTIRRAEIVRESQKATPFSATRCELYKAYLDVVRNVQLDYGVGQITEDAITQAVGTCLVQLVDFDHDGVEEMLLVGNRGYNNEGLYSDAYVEVWSYIDGRAIRVLEGPSDHTNGGFTFVELFEQGDGYAVQFRDFTTDDQGISLWGTTVVTCSGGEEKVLGRFQFQYGVIDPEYYANGQLVSQSEFDKQYTQALEAGSIYRFWFMENENMMDHDNAVKLSCASVLAITEETIATMELAASQQDGSVVETQTQAESKVL